MPDRGRHRYLSAALLFAASCVVIGCAGTPPAPEIDRGSWSGPPMNLDASGRSYVVVMQSPTPGWVPTLDRVEDAFRHRAVFISLRKPNAAFAYPSTAVDQRVLTGVSTSQPVRVYSRVLPHNANPNKADDPYHPAAQSK